MLYTICLVRSRSAPAVIGAAGPVYWVPALALGAAFTYFAWRLL
jgi:heme O synthase-like polyprenyltransferase